MKKLITLLSQKLVVLSLLISVPLISLAQTGMQDIAWFEIAPPNNQADVYETKSVSVNVLDNGKVYMAYVHYNDQELKIAKLNKLQNQWEIVASHVIDQTTGFGVNDMIAYANGNDLYYAVRRNGSPTNLLSFFHFDSDENLTVVLENQAVTFYNIYDFDMTVDVANNIAYFAALNDNFDAVVSACDITNQTFDELFSYPSSFSAPAIAINPQSNTLFFGSVNNIEQVLVRTATLVANYANLNFTLLGGVM
jgi:hypothetical protein